MLITLSTWPKRRRPNTTGSRTAPKPFISDSQWNLIKDLFENPDPSPKGGRPRIDARACLEVAVHFPAKHAEFLNTNSCQH